MNLVAFILLEGGDIMETANFQEAKATRAELSEMLNFEEQLTKKYQQISATHNKRVISHINEFEILRKIFPDFKQNEIDDLVQRTIFDIRQNIVDLNRLTTTMSHKYNLDNVGSKAAILLSAQNGDGVQGLLESEAIYLKMPLLWNRQINKKTTKSKAAQFEKANTVFVNSIEFAIENHPDFQCYDFAKFKEKRFQFLFCYDLQRSKSDRIPDNDNHDFKSVQDAIAQFFYGGDSAFSSETVLSSCASSSVDEGTYVTVTKLSDCPISNQRVIEKWAALKN